jgi:hypothetical protein
MHGLASGFAAPLRASLFALIALAVVSTRPAQAVLVTWNTFGNAGTETSEPSTSLDANLVGTATSVNLTLGPGVIGAGNANRFGGNNWWDSGDTVSGQTLADAIADNDYISFTIAPDPGFTFTATSLVFSWDRSNTGPNSLTLRSSADTFAADLGSVTGMTASLTTGNTLTISGLTDIASSTTFRLYGYGVGNTATAGTGGFDTGSSVNNVVLNGSTAAVPEPTAFLYGGVIVTGLCAWRFRQKRRLEQVLI